MTITAEQSTFKMLYSDEVFVDRYANNPANAVDIIIPVIHTNELWRKNLISIYREIPVNRLLLGDGGCIDNSIEIAKEFPRVEVFDHRSYKTLGYSIRKLIEEVKTEFFIYLHSDVYIAPNWFDGMYKNTEKYDWFECEQKIVAFAEYDNKFANNPIGFGFGGTQMGRKKAFDDILQDMDDDYIYRNEDIVIRTLLQNKGHKWGFDDTLFHYHEIMRKEGFTGRKIESVQINTSFPIEEKIRESDMQVRGFIKYLQPSSMLANVAKYHLQVLLDNGVVAYPEFMEWIKLTNPLWLPYFQEKKLHFKDKIKNKIKKKLQKWLLS